MSEYTSERAALMGYLIGSGKSAEKVAEEFGITAGQVWRQAHKWGIAFGQQPSLTLSNTTYRAFLTAAKSRGISTGDLASRLLNILGKEPILVKNLLDDE